MADLADRFRACPTCALPAAVGPFDLAVVGDDGDERLFFGIPAAICRACCRLFMDREATSLFRIGPFDVLAAIASDSSLGTALDHDAA